MDILELAFEKSAIPNKKGFQLKAENPVVLVARLERFELPTP